MAKTKVWVINYVGISHIDGYLWKKITQLLVLEPDTQGIKFVFSAYLPVGPCNFENIKIWVVLDVLKQL